MSVPEMGDNSTLNQNANVNLKKSEIFFSEKEKNCSEFKRLISSNYTQTHKHTQRM